MSYMENPFSKFGVARSTTRSTQTIFAIVSLMAALMGTTATAQGANDSKPEREAAPKVINIWPGVAPGSEQWKQKEATINAGPMQSIVNVTTPTLTAYLPDPAKATGTAVIIAPGGGFLFLGTDTHEVAEWLAARGIAAFVLKYRTAQIEGARVKRS
jgi:acetyl esterase/lipase